MKKYSIFLLMFVSFMQLFSSDRYGSKEISLSEKDNSGASGYQKNVSENRKLASVGLEAYLKKEHVGVKKEHRGVSDLKDEDAWYENLSEANIENLSDTDIEKMKEYRTSSNDHTYVHLSCMGPKKNSADCSKGLMLCIKNGFDLNASDKNGRTPLHFAVRVHAIGNIEALLRARVKVNCRDNFGETPLHFAGRCASLEDEKYWIDTVRLLINFGADSQARTGVSEQSKGSTPDELLKGTGMSSIREAFNKPPDLLFLIYKGNIEEAKRLADEKKYPLTVIDVQKRTLLHCAALGGHVKGIEFFRNRDSVSLQRNLDAKDVAQQTSLHLASKEGHLAVVGFLGKRLNAKVNVKDESGRTPLHLAVEFLHEPVVKLICELDDINVNLGDEYGFTPLFYLASLDELPIDTAVRILGYLISKKAKLSLEGKTVLNEAFVAGNLSFAWHLLENYDFDDLNTTIKVYDEEYSLMHCATQGTYGAAAFEIIERLMEFSGSDSSKLIAAKDSLGRVPIFYAIDSVNMENEDDQYKKIIEKLLENREALPKIEDPAVKESTEDLNIIVSPWAYAFANNEIEVLRLFVLHNFRFFYLNDTEYIEDDVLQGYKKFLTDCFMQHRKALESIDVDVPESIVNTIFKNEEFVSNLEKILKESKKVN